MKGKSPPLNLIEKAKSHVVVGARLVVRLSLLLLCLLLSGGRRSVGGSGSGCSSHGRTAGGDGAETGATSLDDLGEVLALKRAHDLLESVFVNFDANGSEDLFDGVTRWLRSPEGS